MKDSSIEIIDWQNLSPGDLILIRTGPIVIGLAETEASPNNLAMVICVDHNLKRIDYSLNGKIGVKLFFDDSTYKYLKVKNSKQI